VASFGFLPLAAIFFSVGVLTLPSPSPSLMKIGFSGRRQFIVVKQRQKKVPQVQPSGGPSLLSLLRASEVPTLAESLRHRCGVLRILA
jgi:hypothetical protein